MLEAYTRGFNYPRESDIKDYGDLPELGLKTFFCSNVCAMYDRKTYEDWEDLFVVRCLTRI